MIHRLIMGVPMVFLVVVVGQCIVGVTSHQLPNTFPRCKQSEPDFNGCLTKAIRTSILQLKAGIPELGVPSLDPLQVAAIEIGQGTGPISINMKFTNISVTGLSSATIDTLKANVKDYKLYCDGWIDDIMFESDYEMSGRILLLPVTGKGRCKLTFKKLRSKMAMTGKGTSKKDKIYFDVMECPLEINGLDKLTVHFENLFNGDKTLGESMNTLLNENWKDLWGELRPSFEQSFSAIFKHYSKGIFDKVSFNDVFLE